MRRYVLCAAAVAVGWGLPPSSLLWGRSGLPTVPAVAVPVPFRHTTSLPQCIPNPSSTVHCVARHPTLQAHPHEEAAEDLVLPLPPPASVEGLVQMATAVTAHSVPNWSHSVLQALPTLRTGEDLAQLFRACVDVGGRAKALRTSEHLLQLLRALATEAAKPEVVHRPHTIVDICFSLAFFRLSAVELLDRLAADAEASALTFTSAEAAKLLWACAVMHRREPPLLIALGQQLLAEGNLPTGSDLANAAWALATLEVRDEALLTALARRLLDRQVCALRHAGKLAWAFAKLNVRHVPLLNQLADALVVAGLQWKGGVTEVAEVAWAYATLGVRRPTLMDALVRRTKKPSFLRNMDAEHLIQLLWAFAQLGLSDPELIRAMGQHVSEEPQLLASASSSQLAQVLRSLRRLEVRDPHLWAALAFPLSSRKTLDDFQGSEMCEAFAAVAIWNPEAPKKESLWPGMAQRTLQLASNGSLDGAQVATIITGLGSMQQPPDELRAMVIPLLDTVLPQRILDQLSIGRAADVLHTMATLRILHPKAMKLLASLVLRWWGRKSPPLGPLSAAMWAFATVGLPPTPAMWKAVQKSVSLPGTWSTPLTPPLANLAWALAVSGCTNDTILMPILQWAATRRLGDMDQTKMHQLMVHVLQNGAQLPETATLILYSIQEFQEQCSHTFASIAKAIHAQRNKQQSWLQASIAAALRDLPWKFQEEATLDDAAHYTTDIRLAEFPIAVEVDGPTHFVESPKGLSISGPTAFKRRILTSAGYCVLPIPYFEWAKLDSPKKRQRYLQERLEPIVAGFWQPTQRTM
eukprot:GGOE01041914.1.p1 GENE.GGOE01041914.1~~GGOE01041914.1.p1  ORF type:complete len:808 (+),score=236.47 GGOE01041914.1:64-2487(+)